jgi:hypothetical protein
MGLNWSHQCYAARDRPAADRLAAAQTSVYLLVAAFAVVTLCSFFMLFRQLRAPLDLWKKYGSFLVLVGAGNLLGNLSDALLIASCRTDSPRRDTSVGCGGGKTRSFRRERASQEHERAVVAGTLPTASTAR